MISRVLNWAVFFVIIGGFVFVFHTQVVDGARQIYRMALPCTVPISYKIGTIDKQFGISKATLEKDLSAGSKLWNDAAGKSVLKYDPENGEVTINLAYDARQAMTERLQQLGVTISTDRSSYDIVKGKYDALYAQYQQKKKSFETHVTAFNQAKAAYEKKVDYWNAKGGAPRDQYLQLQMEQTNLTSQSVSLTQEQNALNTIAADVNNLAQALNKLIEILNLEVKKYNTTGQSNGDSFEQGLYERKLGVETITIFEYENNSLLIRVLAHELGHALGLDHVEDPNAIMYYLNQGEAISLTTDDKGELKNVCRL